MALLKQLYILFDHVLLLEFKVVMVLSAITRNYGNYPYGNYVDNAPVGKLITLN